MNLDYKIIDLMNKPKEELIEILITFQQALKKKKFFWEAMNKPAVTIIKGEKEEVQKITKTIKPELIN